MSESNEVVNTGVDLPAPDANPGDSSTPIETVDQTTAAPEEKKPKGVQKRLDELTRQRYEAERDRDYWRDLAMRTVEPPKAPEPEVPQGKPQASNFGTYEEYTEALAEWKVREMISAQQEQNARQAEAQRAQAVEQSFQQRLSAFSAEVDDFHEVALNPSLPVTKDMAAIIKESDMGPALLYHLGKNPNLAREIADLSPTAMARRLGRLEEQLLAPKPKTMTDAPEPIKPVSGGTANSMSDPMKLSPEAWRQWRNEQIYNRKR